MTSQFFGNLSLETLAPSYTEVLRAPCLRDVDDVALFAEDDAMDEVGRARVARFLEGRRLKLHLRKPAILPSVEPAQTPPGPRAIPGVPMRLAAWGGLILRIRSHLPQS